jgi:hypothetical protein
MTQAKDFAIPLGEESQNLKKECFFALLQLVF